MKVHDNKVDFPASVYLSNLPASDRENEVQRLGTEQAKNPLT